MSSLEFHIQKSHPKSCIAVCFRTILFNLFKLFSVGKTWWCWSCYIFFAVLCHGPPEAHSTTAAHVITWGNYYTVSSARSKSNLMTSQQKHSPASHRALQGHERKGREGELGILFSSIATKSIFPLYLIQCSSLQWEQKSPCTSAAML